MKVTPNTTIDLPDINLELSGLAHIRVGVLYAIDVLQNAVQRMDVKLGLLREPEEKPRQYQQRTTEVMTPGKRVSMRGLRRGTDAYREADNHNKQVARDAKRQAEDEEEQLVSLAGMDKSSKAYDEARRRNLRIYSRRQHRKIARKKGKVIGGPPLDPHTTGRMGWAGMTKEERSAEMKRRLALSREKLIAKVKAKQEAGRRGGAKSWDILTNAERKAKIAAMMAGKQRAAEARLNGAA